jgi:energy-coupling factor transporter ATP-binding protein EcfA2
MLAPPVPRLAWAEFWRRFAWEQGEHVSLIGPTGCGKSTLGLALLPFRKSVVILGTKPRDAVLDRLVRTKQYRRLREFQPRPGERRVILWPTLRDPADVSTQRDVLADAFRSIFHSGGWCVYADEARYLCEFLRLEAYLQLLWQQGRSLGISLVANVQRPAGMPLELYNQATHLFLWRETDRVNLTRLGGLGGEVDSTLIRREVTTLSRHEFLYLNTRTGAVARSRVERGRPGGP